MGKQRLEDVAYDSIRKLIINGTLYLGEFLTEASLVERLHMSRTPIRSAVQRLEQDGLLRIFPKQGILVPEISVAQIHEIYDLRIALETFACRRLAQNPLADRIRALQDNLALQQSELATKNAAAFMIHDSHFHVATVSFLDNRELMTAFRRNEDKLLMFGREIFKRDMDRLQLSYDEHVGIVAAIAAGDEIDAVRLMEEHLIRGRAVMLSK